MDESKTTVSYLAFESVQVRLERMNRRLWILCIILIIALIGSNAGWIWYESQFDETVVTQEADIDTGNGDAIISNIGDIDYGKDKN